MPYLNEAQIVWVENRIDKYNRKAKRLKQDSLQLLIGEKYDLQKEMESWVDYPLTYEQLMEYPEDTLTFVNKKGSVIQQDLAKLRKAKWDCTILGQIPKLPEWEILGKIEAGPEGMNLISEAPGKNVPEKYREGSLYCDHCGHNRRRNKTVILEKNGKVIQVGSNCLADFIGDGNAEGLIDLAMIWAEFSSECPEEEDWGGCSRWAGYDLEKYLSLVVCFTRDCGYTSRSNQNEFHTATSQLASCEYHNKRKDQTYPIIPMESIETAKKVIQFFKDMDKETASKNNFVWNLWLIAKEPFVQPSKTGFAAYMHQFWLKEMNQAPVYEKKQERSNEFLGEEKQKVTLTGTLKSIKYIPGAYGSTTLYSFEDDKGNSFCWFSSSGDNNLEDNQGKTFEVSGTVKRHNVYESRKQTVLIRCKVKQLVEA